MNSMNPNNPNHSNHGNHANHPMNAMNAANAARHGSAAPPPGSAMSAASKSMSQLMNGQKNPFGTPVNGPNGYNLGLPTINPTAPQQMTGNGMSPHNNVPPKIPSR